MSVPSPPDNTLRYPGRGRPSAPDLPGARLSARTTLGESADAFAPDPHLLQPLPPDDDTQMETLALTAARERQEAGTLSVVSPA